MGKVSFMVHGAHRKKSPMGAYFQPINCLELVYYFKESRDLQTISKAAFSNNWSVIPTDLKKISYAMALIELTDKCLTDHDAHPDLYDELVRALKRIDQEEKQLNLAYWFYQYQLLKHLGFKPDFLRQSWTLSPFLIHMPVPIQKRYLIIFNKTKPGCKRD
jgi:Recombinational DNA repair protein (RecF pathway)